jgi:hypothetical protein
MWLYYTSTFRAARLHMRVDSSQVIDAMAIAQNGIDVTCIDGNHKNKGEKRQSSRAVAQRRGEGKNREH